MMGFGCLLGIFRFFASIILGLAIFLAVLVFLLITNFRDNFLTSEFYTEPLAEHNVYQRIYTEVLVDPEFEDTTAELLGEIDVPQSDIVKVTEDIIRPEYLQQEVEAAIEGAIDYLNKETETPEVYIHLREPLDRTKPTLFKYIDQRIDGLQDVPVNTMDELQTELEKLYLGLEEGKIPDKIPFIVDADFLVASYVDSTIAGLEEVPVSSTDDLEARLEDIQTGLTEGEFPTSIPSLKNIPIPDRLAAWDSALDALRQDGSIPPAVLKSLEEQDDEIKDQLVEGTVKGALEAATSGALEQGTASLTGPAVEEFVDDAYDMVRQTLEDANLSEKALAGLDRESEAIKKTLGAGQIKESLKIGARALAGPLIDSATDELREELDSRARLDVIQRAADNAGQTREEFLDDLDVVRNVIERTDVGVWLAILVIAGGSFLMGIIYFPHMASGFRWPGLTLLLNGGLFLIIGLLLGKLGGEFDELLDKGTESTTTIPQSLIDVVSDVLTSMQADVADGFMIPSIVLVVIGLAMLIMSFLGADIAHSVPEPLDSSPPHARLLPAPASGLSSSRHSR